MTVMHRNNYAQTLLCVLLLVFSVVTPGCRKTADKKAAPSPNLNAKAVEIAEALAMASGGRENWQNTRYLAWNYYGKRLNVWDKQAGDIRIETKSTVILMNLNTKQGRAWLNGIELTEPEDWLRAKEFALETWEVDSYWIFMPFMLGDEGVSLQYVGEDQTEEGQKTDVLSATFTKSLQAESKYHIHVGQDSKLLVRMTYYMDSANDRPSYTAPWKDYKQYGKILLSADRGEKQHTELGVFDNLPESVFNSPEPFEWTEIDSINKLKS